MTFTVDEVRWAVVMALLVGAWGGLLLGAWLADRKWRDKANGPSRMLSGGRFYQVLTSEAYQELIDR